MSSDETGSLPKSTLKLSNEQIEMLSQFCLHFYSNRKLGTSIGLTGDDLKAFVVLSATPGTDIYNTIEVARLQHQGTLNFQLAESAKASSTAHKDFMKSVQKEKSEALKEELFPGYEQYKKIPKHIRDSYNYHASHFEQLQSWIESGKSTELLPQQLKEYWRRLKIVRDISNDFTARAKGNQYMINLIIQTVECSESHAYLLIREASSFFNITEPKSVWYHRLLVDLDRIKALAFAENKLDEVNKAIQIQRSIIDKMKDETELPKEIYEGRTIITSHKPEDFGLEPVNRKELEALIDSWELDQEEKKRIKLEAGISGKDKEIISE